MQVVKPFIPAIAAALALVAAAPAGAAYREIGVPNGERLPAASCPEDCEVLARVTGYQVQVGEVKNPYQVNRPGKITAFTISLGKPSNANIRGFDDLFGESRARISILKLARTKRRARLVAQSEVFDLSPYFGSTPTFALDRPLNVDRRHVVALTIPTWAPAFSIGLPRDNAWRAPRDPGDCDDLENPATQQTVGSLRRYQCFYRTARLVYSATYVPDPKPTTEEQARNNR
jgi:hypothetical protein